MAQLAIFFLLAFVATAMSLRHGMGLMNPITVFVTVWVAVVVVYQVPGLDLLTLTSNTWVIVIAGFVSVTAGALAAWKLCSDADRGRQSPTVARQPGYDEVRLSRWYRVGVVLLIGYVLLQFFRIWPAVQAEGGLRAILLGGSGLAFRRGYSALDATTAATGFSGTSAVTGVLSYILFLGSMTLFWAGYYARRSRWILALAPVAVMAIFSLVLLQRFALVYSLLLFAFGYYYHRNVAPNRAPPDRLRVAAMVAVGLAVVGGLVLLPIQLRNPGISRTAEVENVATYYVAGLAGLNSLDARDAGLASATAGTVARVPDGRGVWTFTGAASILGRAGLPVTAPSAALGYVPVQRSGDVEINVYSYLIFFYYDFGYSGVVLLSLLLGGLAGWAHFRSTRRDLKWIPISCLAMTTLAMSFFSLSLVRDFEYFFLALTSPALTRLVMGRGAPPSAGQR